MGEHTKDIREAIDACRPGTDDLHMREFAHLAEQVERNPEIRRLYEGTQRLDAAIAGAFRDEPVPDGLDERLLASLAWEGGDADEQPADSLADTVLGAGTEPTPCDQPLASPLERPRSRRRVWLWPTLVATTAVVVVAGVVVTALIFSQEPQPIAREEFIQLAVESVAQTLDENQWRQDMAAAPPDRPYPEDAVLAEPHGWRWVRTSFDSRTVAYNLTARLGSGTVLLVARSKVKVNGLNVVPPLKPLPVSGNQSVGAWQKDGLVYVLVVRGADHRNRYPRMVRALNPII